MMPIFLALAFIAVIFIVLVTGLRDETTVTRSAKISAPPEKIFQHVNDLHNWEAWSPWAKLDPNAKNAFEGAASGTGASMSWAGNCKIGVGRMTITDSKASESICLRLNFEKPMKATNLAEFIFKSEGSHTVVTWAMTAKNQGISKVFGLIFNCDKMIGDQFEKGLANLKSVVESKG
jgi:hypothetical protein